MLDASLFWRNRFHGIHLVEFIGMIKIWWGERRSYFRKEKINTTKKWHDIFKKQHDILLKLLVIWKEKIIS